MPLANHRADHHERAHKVPGLDYDVVRIVPAGTQGRIFGIDPDDDCSSSSWKGWTRWSGSTRT